ncbi:MAG: heterodisulfide reductase-related iron-sulfur binding cluster, partial [Methanomicrobiaceae archaeon]|nr:heterodisulfide reductase-related iron-sulfur binding cluster [Methanomicrobiaceae archaeon]
MAGDMREYAFFLGCIAPNRYPGIEASAIKTSEKVGIRLVPLNGASCCPAPGAFGSADLNVWYAMAARNVVLAEQMKKDIALICNGCYKSIWEVNHILKNNDELRDGVNEVLKEIDMEFKGSVDVWHLAELYYDPAICGVEKIRASVTRPLSGTKVAVHYGCHLMKPRKERHFGDTDHPMWAEELVGALGAEPVQYRNKMQCCGAGGGRLWMETKPEWRFSDLRIHEACDTGASILATACPYCISML